MLALPSRIRVALLAIAAAGSIVIGDAAHAASCRAMKAELVSLSGKNSGSKRYRSAIRRQRTQMRRVELMLTGHSCRTRRSQACTTLRNSFREMERNLRKLKRSDRASGSSTKRRRTRLRKQIATRCGARVAKAPRRAERAAPKERRTVSDQARRPTRRSAGTTFRTMCVRLCDGLAFPVSLSTAPRQFAKDAQACNALCPGTASRLYAAPARVSGLEEARDVETGELYPELSTAFRHRKTFDRACSCRFGGAQKLDYGRRIEGPVPKREAELKPARTVRIIGRDYFRN